MNYLNQRYVYPSTGVILKGYKGIGQGATISRKTIYRGYYQFALDLKDAKNSNSNHSWSLR